jgi:pimeloyl-ACP methyl ester carboxylesterase
MPQAKALRIAGAGHGVSREQPEAFNAAVLEFLDARPTSR